MSVLRPVVLWTLVALYASLSAAGSARGESGAYAVSSEVGTVTDLERDRAIAYTLYYPEQFPGAAYILLFSHGGAGSASGHTRYRHFGERWAAAGYIGLHINHLESADGATHRADRPKDVSFVIDALQSGLLQMPFDFEGSLILDRFGHSGHSYGAYTSMALAGGQYAFAPNFRDARIVAFAPVSPQGAGQFGAYDLGPPNNTWSEINLPMLNIVGGDEIDTNAIGTIQEAGWRLTPFERYPMVGDKFQIILPDQDHADLGAFPSEPVGFYLGENTRLFFDVYLRNRVSGVCAIGLAPSFPGEIREGKPALGEGLAEICPPPIGVPEPQIRFALWIAIPALLLASKPNLA
ncbi:MAG: alpha/beta hydrolase family protein [Myxococcota bacterium]